MWMMGVLVLILQKRPSSQSVKQEKSASRYKILLILHPEVTRTKVSYNVTDLQYIGESQIQKIKNGKGGILSQSSLMDVSNTKTDTRRKISK